MKLNIFQTQYRKTIFTISAIETDATSAIETDAIKKCDFKMHQLWTKIRGGEDNREE